MATGKYAKVINQLPRLLGAEPQYQQKVEAVKAAMVAEPDFERHASALARQYTAIRIEQAKVAEILAEVNLRLEAVSQLMFDQYEAEGVESLKVDGRTIAARLVPYSVVQDKEAFRQWCLQEPDLARLMTLPWMTVDKISKDRLVAGEEPPPGVTIYAKQRFTLGSE
jgi:hypothetical protein